MGDSTRAFPIARKCKGIFLKLTEFIHCLTFESEYDHGRIHHHVVGTPLAANHSNWKQIEEQSIQKAKGSLRPTSQHTPSQEFIPNAHQRNQTDHQTNSWDTQKSLLSIQRNQSHISQREYISLHARDRGYQRKL